MCIRRGQPIIWAKLFLLSDASLRLIAKLCSQRHWTVAYFANCLIRWQHRMRAMYCPCCDGSFVIIFAEAIQMQYVLIRTFGVCMTLFERSLWCVWVNVLHTDCSIWILYGYWFLLFCGFYQPVCAGLVLEHRDCQGWLSFCRFVIEALCRLLKILKSSHHLRGSHGLRKRCALWLICLPLFSSFSLWHLQVWSELVVVPLYPSLSLRHWQKIYLYL